MILKGRYTRALRAATGLCMILGFSQANAQNALPSITPSGESDDVMICDDLDDDGVLDEIGRAHV